LSHWAIESLISIEMQMKARKVSKGLARGGARRFALLAGMLGAILGSAAGQTKPAADLIVTHAKIWTVDKSRPAAEAVAVLGERIVAVGTSAEVAAWQGPGTKMIDAGGKLLLPGFNDGHVHFVSGGMQLDNVDLKDADSQEEFARRIGDRAAAYFERINWPGKYSGLFQGDWILGGDWDHERWSPAELPTKELIDAFTPTTPVFVNRYDGHMALANSVALRLAHVTAKTPDPPGGSIVRDAQGNPTGVLKGAAMDYVYKVIPPLTPERRMQVVKRALEAYTMGSAYAEFQEKEKGSITPGKLADMVLLSDDIFRIPPEAVKDVKVELTMVGGRVVFERPGSR
jgi:hypothetical protein